jgi:uncharacterized membrane protein YcaP (DUF421 family)
MDTIFGVQNDVTTAQECARAIVVFFHGLLLLRLSGRRTFGNFSALDVIVSVIVGSALARAMTGSAPLGGTLAASAVLVALHVVLSKLVAWSPRISRFVEGRAVTLAKMGHLDEEARRAAMISEADLSGAMRQHGLRGLSEIAKVDTVVLEPSGRISVLRKKPERN